MSASNASARMDGGSARCGCGLRPSAAPSGLLRRRVGHALGDEEIFPQVHLARRARQDDAADHDGLDARQVAFGIIREAAVEIVGDRGAEDGSPRNSSRSLLQRSSGLREECVSACVSRARSRNRWPSAASSSASGSAGSVAPSATAQSSFNGTESCAGATAAKDDASSTHGNVGNLPLSPGRRKPESCRRRARSLRQLQGDHDCFFSPRCTERAMFSFLSLRAFWIAASKSSMLRTGAPLTSEDHVVALHGRLGFRRRAVGRDVGDDHALEVLGITEGVGQFRREFLDREAEVLAGRALRRPLPPCSSRRRAARRR